MSADVVSLKLAVSMMAFEFVGGFAAGASFGSWLVLRRLRRLESLQDKERGTNGNER